MARTKPALISARQLFATAIKDFWRFRLQLIGVVAIVALPLAVLSRIGSLGQDSTFSAYSSFLSIIMNVALIWLIIKLKNGQNNTVADAYYRGTGTLVRFILLFVCYFFMAVPFLIGALFYIQGVSGTTIAASGSEKLLLGVAWLLLAAPTLWLLSRFTLATYAMVEQDLAPIAALSASNLAVQGRTLRVLGRMVTMILTLLVVIILPVIIAAALLPGGLPGIGQSILQLISILILLPIANLYLYELYRALSHDRA